MATATNSVAPSSRPWRLLLEWRWPLAGVIGLAFAAGQVLEGVLLGAPRPDVPVVVDIVGWGLLGAAAVWVSLTWVSRQERRYEAGLTFALLAQQRLNGQLRLLSEVNHHLAASSTLDAILDAALTFPQRLAPVQAAALLLRDGSGPTEARARGASAEDLARWRARFGVAEVAAQARQPGLVPAPTELASLVGPCLVVPLHDGESQVGWIELYLTDDAALAEDELELLGTIAGEIAEAITSTRRRVREASAIHELEQAITEERARIARDIHDGLAQSLAFLRLRVDLWQDWIADDPARLRDELRGLKTTLREQIQELRRAIFALRPIQFDELGFEGGLQRYVSEFAEQQGWAARIDLGDAPRGLPHPVEAICFRLVQEALTNIAKHATASRVTVAITQHAGGLLVRVTDDGRGFVADDAAEASSGRLGLRQMRERLTSIRGDLTVISQPGAGTEVRAWLPLEVQP